MHRVVLASVTVAAIVAATGLGWFEVRQGREFRRIVAVGDAALAHDQTSSAIEAYSGAIALRRDSMVGWLKRGDTYRRRGEFRSALRDLQQAATLDATAPRPLELLGDVNAALGRHAQAAGFYAGYVMLDDRAPRVLYKLALSQYRDGRIAPALESARKAIAIDRELAEAYYLIGLCERDSRRAEEAIAAFSRAVSLNAAFEPARAELAALAATLGRRRDAVQQLEALAALEPERPDYLIEVALAYARTGRFESALLTLGRAAERYPDAASVYLTLARLWLDEAEGAQDGAAATRAAHALHSAAAFNTNAPELLLLQGRVDLLDGNPAAAEKSLEAATAALPVDPDAFRYLAAAAERLGHRELARVSRARYAALTP